MKKTLLIILSIFLITLIGVHADGFIVTPETITNNIFPDEKAKFSIDIMNLESVRDAYTVYSKDIAWNVDTSGNFTIDPGATSTVELVLIPNVWAGSGAKEVDVIIESQETDNKFLITLPIYVKSDSAPRNYAPSIELVVEMDEKFDPRDSIPITMYIRNRNRLDIENLKILIESGLFSKELNFHVGPLEEKTERQAFRIDKLTAPKDDQIWIRLVYENKTVNQMRQHFSIIKYSDMVVSADKKKEFFKTVLDVTITNNGNIYDTKSYDMPISSLAKIFTTTDPKADVKYEGKQKLFSWDANLEPTETMTIRTVTDYRPLIYVLAVILVMIVLYFIYRSPIIVKKETMVLGSQDSGISEMKVVLYIKNRTHDILESINITDKIPGLAELISESYLGTLEPSKILKHDKKGTIVKWEIKSLEPFEERIITYRIRSKLSIFGGIALPPTRVKYETKRGRERHTHSNRVDLKLKYK